MPNPLQPRMMFKDQAIDELAQSIKEAGVLQPVLCVPEEGDYKILTGERRLRAAKKAGLQKMPVLIRNIPAERQLEISLIENLQREELNPIEIALAYKRLIEELNYTQEEVGTRVGKDRTSVTNYLRLLNLSEEVQRSLKESKISMGHARALLAEEIPEIQAKLCRKIIQRNLSVREVEKLVSKRKLVAVLPGEAPSVSNRVAPLDEPVQFLETKEEMPEKPGPSDDAPSFVLILENDDPEKTLASLVKEMEDHLRMISELKIQLEKLIDTKFDELMKAQSTYQKIKTLEQGSSRVAADGTLVPSEAIRAKIAEIDAILQSEGETDRIKQEIENLQLIRHFVRSPNALSNFSPIAGHGFRSETMAGLAVGEKKILVIEDDPVSRKLLSHFLKKEKYRVRNAASAEEGFQSISQERPDLILLDIMLPGVDGFQFLSRLKETESGPLPPVFVISSLTKESDIVKALQAGATDYILKPFSPQVILAKVRQILRSNR